MRSKNILIMILCTLTFQASAQNYTLKGFMGVQGGESFTYELKLESAGGGLLKGTASTYADPRQPVVATVEATLDRAAKTLNIKEQVITENKGFKSKALICLVEASLQYEEAEKKLTGPLNTHTMGNGAACSKGSITFMNPAELDALFRTAPAEKEPISTAVIKQEKPAQPKPDSSKPIKIVYDTATAPAPFIPKKITEDITEGTDKTFLWHTDSLIVELWDGNTVDGDRVTVQYNGSDVLPNYILSGKKKRLNLSLGGNELNILSINAINEGSEPPNTANLTLYDGDLKYEVVAHNKAGKRAIIKIRKAP